MVIYNMFVPENKQCHYQLTINNLFKYFLLFYWRKKVNKNHLFFRTSVVFKRMPGVCSADGRLA